jgi:hypothetical protein
MLMSESTATSESVISPTSRSNAFAGSHDETVAEKAQPCGVRRPRPGC